MKISKRNVPLIMVGVLLPVIVYADAAVPNPKLMFENSNIVGIDNAVNAYSVPISNSKGVISYYDLAIDFTPNANGSVPTTANVTFVPSPVVSAKSVVAGNYNDTPATGTCTVTNAALQIGRTESLFNCTDDYGNSLAITVVNGAINTGHPFYQQLHYAGIDKRTDQADYYWGMHTGGGGYNLGGCKSFANSAIVGVQQIGSTIMLSAFDPNAGNFNCTGRIAHN